MSDNEAKTVIEAVIARATLRERNRVIKWLEDHARGHEHGGEDAKADVLREKAKQIRRGDHTEDS